MLIGCLVWKQRWLAVRSGHDADWLFGIGLAGWASNDLEIYKLGKKRRKEGEREEEKRVKDKEREKRRTDIKERRRGRVGKKGIGNTREGRRKKKIGKGERKGREEHRERQGQGREVMTSRAWAWYLRDVGGHWGNHLSRWDDTNTIYLEVMRRTWFAWRGDIFVSVCSISVYFGLMVLCLPGISDFDVFEVYWDCVCCVYCVFCFLYVVFIVCFIWYTVDKDMWLLIT